MPLLTFILITDLVLAILLGYIIYTYYRPVKEYRYQTRTSEVVDLKLDIDYVKTKQKV